MAIGDTPETWRTLEAWNAEGYKVMKGSRSQLRSPQGYALFNEYQVEEVDSYFTDASEADLY